MKHTLHVGVDTCPLCETSVVEVASLSKVTMFKLKFGSNVAETGFAGLESALRLNITLQPNFY
jgi:hypothetical protein